jgi:putative intracellular protease/amidase
MTINCYFLTMPKSLTIALLAYDGFQLLDVTGPVAVFAAANHELKGNFLQGRGAFTGRRRCRKR